MSISDRISSFFQSVRSRYSDDRIEENPIEMPTEYREGQCFAISFEHELVRKGVRSVNSAKGILEIEKIADEFFVGTWTISSLETGGEEISAYDEGADDVLIGIPIKFQAALDGSVERIIDKDACLSKVLNSDLFDDLDHEKKSKIFDMLSKMSDSGLAQHFLKVPSILAICQDTSLTLGKPIVTESETLSTFGNGTYTTHTTFLSKGKDQKTGRMQIEYTSEANSEELAKIVLDFLRENSPETKFSKSDMKKIKSVQQSQHCTAWVDMQTGLALEATFEKIIDLPGNAPRLDRYKIVSHQHA